MALQTTLSAVSDGYLCPGPFKTLAIASSGYLCLVVIVELDMVGGGAADDGETVGRLVDDRLVARLRREDEEIVSLFMVAMIYRIFD